MNLNDLKNTQMNLNDLKNTQMNLNDLKNKAANFSDTQFGKDRLPVEPKLITWGTGGEIDIDLMERTYNEVYPTLIGEMCDKKTRYLLKTTLENKLPGYDIKCDEENNPPAVLDSQNIMARVSKIVNNTTFYIDLIF